MSARGNKKLVRQMSTASSKSTVKTTQDDFDINLTFSQNPNPSKNKVKRPPQEIFSISFDSDEVSVGSAGDKINAWSSGAEKFMKQEASDLKHNKNKPGRFNSSSVGNRITPKSDATPSLGAVSRASLKVRSINREKVMSRRRSDCGSEFLKTGVNSKQFHKRDRVTSSKRKDIDSISTASPDLDPEAQKMSDIASKYLFADAFTEDETMSTITSRDASKGNVWIYCYIGAFSAFVLGAFLAYTIFIIGNSNPYENPTDAHVDGNITTPLSVDEVMPFLQKMSSPEILTKSGTPQNQALEWLQSKDAVPHGYNSTHQIIQRFILATFFYSTKGFSAWDDSKGWLSETNECSWDGITCFKHNLEFSGLSYISTITLPKKGLSGELPREIGFLSYLRNLTVSNNDIIGSIPTTLNKLTNLLALNLNGNALTGSIPENMENMVALRDINLAQNRLKKRLPDLGDIDGLEHIDFSDNDLTGNIPFDYTNLEKLKYLNLENNELDGEIPYSIDKLKNLEILNVAQNGLLGTIPDALSNIETLQQANLDGNIFVGEIPAALGLSKSLKKLSMENNNLEGSMPVEVCNLDLQELAVDCDSVECSCCTNC